MKTWPSLIAMFIEQANNLGEKPYLWGKKNKEYKSISWKQSLEKSLALANELKKLNINKGDRILLCSESRPEWILAYFAIMAAGGIVVPAYTTNTENDHAHIISDSGAKGIIVSSKNLALKLLSAAHKTENVNFIISIENIKNLQSSKINILNWEVLVEKRMNNKDQIPKDISSISKEDIALIIYTSGTGGTPKGVMLSHRAILHNCRGTADALREIIDDDEVFLSFLPLSHSYEHIGGVCFPIYIGAQVYFAEGLEHLTKNMSEARPTIMTAVPRLYELMHSKITKNVIDKGGIKAKLFLTAVNLGKKRFNKPNNLNLKERSIDILLDRLIRKKIKATFGGRLKALASGGAPLNPDIGMFFTALGLNLLQGYGQTESAPIISFNRPNKVKIESVGIPILDTEVKIASDGEILVRGDLLMSGYWNNNDATNKAIQNGWLYTGDIGIIDNENYIHITDRKKDIIINSGGDNLSPQRIEGFLTLEPQIAQAMVYGDRKPHIVALIVPDKEFMMEWAKSSRQENNFTKIIKNKEFMHLIYEAIESTNKNLSVIEKVRRFILTAEEFTVNNEMMTPTLKVRRHVITEKYASQLETLYKK
jgi:long-chain acyl-CoA synthetase